MIKLLKDKGANLNFASKIGRTPLHLAAEYGCVAAVKTLIDIGANIEATDTNGNTALHCAAVLGRVAAVKTLIDMRANLEATNANGGTALHWAAQYGHVTAVKILLTAGADLNAADVNGDTALYWAAKNGSTKIVDTLIKEGANLNVTGFNGGTALHLAADNGSTEIVDTLIKGGANPNVTDLNGDTALHWAAKNGSTEIVDTLIKGGANLNVNGFNGCTALHVAAVMGNEKVVKVLLEAGAKPDVTDKDGTTPLSLAVDKGQIEVAKILLAAGSNPNTFNNDGKTPSDVATTNHYTNIVKLLEDAVAISKAIEYFSKDTNGNLIDNPKPPATFSLNNFDLLQAMIAYNFKIYLVEVRGQIKCKINHNDNREKIKAQLKSVLALITPTSPEQKVELYKTKATLNNVTEFIDQNGIPTLKYLAAANFLINTLKTIAEIKDLTQQLTKSEAASIAISPADSNNTEQVVIIKEQIFDKEVELIDSVALLAQELNNMPEYLQEYIKMVAELHSEAFEQIAKTHSDLAISLQHVVTCTDEQREQFAHNLTQIYPKVVNHLRHAITSTDQQQAEVEVATLKAELVTQDDSHKTSSDIQNADESGVKTLGQLDNQASTLTQSAKSDSSDLTQHVFCSSSTSTSNEDTSVPTIGNTD